MPDNPASAALAEIRERGYENGAHGAEAARLSDAAATYVPRLLAAVDRVLKVADERDAEADEIDVPDDPRTHLAAEMLRDLADEFRSAILAALTGKGG